MLVIFSRILRSMSYLPKLILSQPGSQPNILRKSYLALISFFQWFHFFPEIPICIVISLSCFFNKYLFLQLFSFQNVVKGHLEVPKTLSDGQWGLPFSNDLPTRGGIFFSWHILIPTTYTHYTFFCIYKSDLLMLLDLKQLSIEALAVYLKDFNCALKSIGHLCKVIYYP